MESEHGPDLFRQQFDLLDLKDMKPGGFNGRRTDNFKPWARKLKAYGNGKREGFRRALETMKVNERGRISMEARHAFGDEGPSEELRRQWGFTREVPGGAEIHIHCEIEDLRYTEALDNSLRGRKLCIACAILTPERLALSRAKKVSRSVWKQWQICVQCSGTSTLASA